MPAHRIFLTIYGLLYIFTGFADPMQPINPAIIKFENEERVICFIEDTDGNLIEIYEVS